MEITTETPEWTSEDVVNLRTFLKSQSGTRFLSSLAETAPVLFDEGDINKILIRSGEVRGSMAFLRSIMALAYPANPPKMSETNINYPELTNDKAWDDSQKLNPVGMTLNPNH
jgi:hypothetical protein